MLDPDPVADSTDRSDRDNSAADTPPIGLPAVSDSLGELGAYRLISILGEGTMATVYAAQHSKLGRRCAIKRLRPEHLVDREMVQRFIGEARTVASIQHPNLVTIYDVIEEPGEVYLVMELLDGRDLQTALQTGSFTIDRAMRVGSEICDALGPVHGRAIVHRDIKPANVFLCIVSGREQVKMLDFGAARLLGKGGSIEIEMKERGATVGSPLYMSPEQIQGETIDGRSDIYSIGVVLFEMLAGKPPFTGEQFSDVLLQHLHAPPRTLTQAGASVSREVEQVVARCLAKKPGERFQSVGELAQELRRLGGSSVIIDPSHSSPGFVTTAGFQRLPAASPRTRSFVAPAIVAGAIVIAGGLAFAFRRPPPAPRPVVIAPPPIAAPVVVPPPPAPTTRTVQLYSDPPGAVADVDGMPEGCITPCMISLPVGETSVTFKKPGYKNTTTTVPPGELKARAELPLLEPAPPLLPSKPSAPANKKKKHTEDAPAGPDGPETINPFAH